jgi:hypothetical protein
MKFEGLREAYYRLPDWLQRAILVKRREAIWIQAGILFIHVPKAAGTSFNQALYGRFMGHVRAKDIARWGSPRLKELARVAVTRNPWDRLLSAYRFAKHGGGVGGANAGGIRNPEQYQAPEFETFETFVTDWLAPRDPARLDYVFQPQSLYVCDGHNRVIVDHIGHYEDLQGTVDFIRQTLPAFAGIPRSNRSGDPLDYRRFYTPKLIEIVGAKYAQDVTNFGYEFG